MVQLRELMMILELHRQGLSVTAIARRTGRDPKTVRKYIERGIEAPAYGPRSVGRPGKLAPYLDFLRERVTAFPDLSAARLTREMGYAGACRAVKRYLAAIRREVRQTRTRPVVDALKSWLDDTLARISGRAKLADVIRYAIRHWPGLIRFLDDGRIEIDSNTVERSIRPIALTRKNALFAGHDRGGVHWGTSRHSSRHAKSTPSIPSRRQPPERYASSLIHHHRISL